MREPQAACLQVQQEGCAFAWSDPPDIRLHRSILALDQTMAAAG
jgi:hypothetical protein